MLQVALLEYPAICRLKDNNSEFSPYMERSEFDTHMDLESLDATQIKYLIQTMFEGIEFTIYPHSMLSDLKPFIIFAPIPMN